MRRPADALLLDLDGTLVDTAPGIAAVLNQMLEARGGAAVTASTVRGWISLGADRLISAAMGPSLRTVQADLAEFRTLLRAREAPAGQPYPGVEAGLARACDAGWRLAVVTNKLEGLSRLLMAQLGLDRWVEVVVGGDTAGFAKPHAAPVLAALSRLDRTPEQAVFIGDSEVDAHAARGLAIPFYLFEGGYGVEACPPELVAGSFDDLSVLVNELERVRSG